MNGSAITYRRHYARFHPDDDVHFEEMLSAEMSWLSEFAPAELSARILDIGCGAGFVVGGFSRLGYSITGIDSDIGQVDVCLKRNLPVRHIEAADLGAWLDQQHAQYDLITAIDVLEHIPAGEQMQFLRRVHAALAPGGRFVCRVPNANSSLAMTFRYIDWTHRCSFTEHSLDFVLFNSGFSAIKIIETPMERWLSLKNFYRRRFIFGCFFRWLRRLEMIGQFGPEAGNSIPLTINILGIASK